MDGRTLRGKTVMFLVMCVFMAVFLALFGTNYAVVGVTVATAAMIMLSKDLSVRPLANLGSIMAFMVMMGVGAYIASLDPYLGLLVNFVVVFLIVFLSMQDLRSPMHFPLLLFYATMVTLPITLDQMPDRLLVLAVSAVFIVGLNVAVNRGSRSRTSHDGIVSMCGEMAGDPDYLPILVGMGFDELSMSAHSILESKKRIRMLDKSCCTRFVNHVLSLPDAVSVEAALKEFTEQYGKA